MPNAVKRAVLNAGLRGKELRVGRIRARIPALDVVDAEVVEHGRDAPLVLEREVDARRLRAVAQCRVEEV